MGLDNFTRIPNGTGSLEERMKVMWTEGVVTGRLTPNEFVAVTSTNAAQIFNVYPQKGVVREGSDADLVVWDPTAEATISVGKHHSKLDVNVLEGYRAKGLPKVTVSQGRVVWQGRRPPGHAGLGPQRQAPAPAAGLRGAGAG
jgi:dihydropyrimidinase